MNNRDVKPENMIQDRDPGDEDCVPLVRCGGCARWIRGGYETCPVEALCVDCRSACWLTFGPDVQRLPVTSAPLPVPEAST